jgi:hypothetical protein
MCKCVFIDKKGRPSPAILAVKKISNEFNAVNKSRLFFGAGIYPSFSQFRGIKTTTLVRLLEQRTSVLTISLMPLALVKKDRAL